MYVYLISLGLASNEEMGVLLKKHFPKRYNLKQEEQWLLLERSGSGLAGKLMGMNFHLLVKYT